MKYQNPKCECGEELIIYSEYIVLEETAIANAGKESKRPFASTDTAVGDSGCKRLECNNSRSYYEIYFDKDGRITRGKLLYCPKRG